MSDTSTVPCKSDGQEPARQPVVGPELADQLLARAEAGGVELLGPDGLLAQVTKSVLERALAEELTGHLGYEKHDPVGWGSGNSPNGTTGEVMRFTGTTVLKVANGFITEEIDLDDGVTALRQLGLITRA